MLEAGTAKSARALPVALEQLNCIAAWIFAKDLPATWAIKDVISKGRAMIAQQVHPRTKIIDVKDDPGPATRRRLAAIRHRLGGRGHWSSKPQAQITIGKDCHGWAVTLLQLEAQSPKPECRTQLRHQGREQYTEP
jgi:hypothetical protein